MIVATYPTKKALREAVGEPLKYKETSLFGPEFNSNGTQAVVGPDTYNRKWWAQVTCKRGIIEKVK